jgi:hypothetical protein
MTAPKLMPDKIAQVSGLVSTYIASQRERYVSRSIPLTTAQKNILSGFFSNHLLENTRVLVLAGERVANPDFYPMLMQLGFKNLPDQSTMAAITFCDVVVSHEPFSDALLFHELVHVEQYRQLRISRFSDLYVRGSEWRQPRGDSLEINAYTLEGCFEANPTQPFAISEEVKAWIDGDRF